MKLFTKIASLMLIIVMCTVALTSCGVIDFVTGLFAGSPAEDPQDALQALKDNDYRADLNEYPTYTVVEGTKGSYSDDDFEAIEIRYFSSEEEAKDYCEQQKKQMEASIELMKAFMSEADAEELEEAEKAIEQAESYIFDYSGCIAWMATSNTAVGDSN